MKLTLPTIIALLIAVSTGFSQFTNGDWTYTTNAFGEARVTQYAGADSSVVVPDELSGFPVTGFGEDFVPVFGYGNSNVASVVFPASVTNIATYAFYESLALTNITVDAANANYASVGGVLFDKLVTALLSYPAGRPGAYVIPDGVTRIAEVAFAKNTGLTFVSIPNDVTEIADYAFYGCISLPNIVLPDSTTNVGNYSFKDCTSLTNATVGSGLASFGTGPLDGCELLASVDIVPGNPTFASSNGVVFSKDMDVLIFYPFAKPGNYVVPDGVSTIAGSAFGASTGLTGVTLPDSVTVVGDYAFTACTNLVSVTFGAGVEALGDGVFSDCIGLTSLTLPGTVTSLGDYVFSGCAGLTGMLIPAGVTSIGISAFNACTALASIEVDAANPHYTSVDGVLFDEAVANLLTYPNAKPGAYSIPGSVTQISFGAFGPSPGLTAVVVPNSVTNLPSFAFGECSSLTNVTIGAWISQDFPNSYSGFGSAFPNSVSRVTIADGVSGIGSYAFAYCAAMTSVSIPGSVTNIGNGAFIGCTGLTSVSVPAGVAGIGSSAFAYCENLSSAVFAGSLTSIASDSFDGCGNLQSILFKADAPSDTAWTTTLPASPTILYLSGTAGWGPTFGNLPTQLFLPQAVTPSYGPATGFRFFWSGTGTIPMDVQRATSLSIPWSVVSSNNPTGEYTDATPPAGKAFYRAVLP